MSPQHGRGLAVLTTALIAAALAVTAPAYAAPLPAVATHPVAATRTTTTTTATAAALTTTAVTTTAVTSTAVTPTVRVVAAGDIAQAGGAQAATARLAAALRPGVVLALGDLAYQQGTLAQFAAYYNPTWGALKAKTWPIPGNHEHYTAGAAGYKAYWGIAGSTWYAKRAGAWTVIALDSQYPTSTYQLTWLKATLAANNGRPTLVMWHRPRLSSGAHGNQPDVQPLYQVVAADPDVKILLWGHDHHYQRMALSWGARVPFTGFLVGTGGSTLRATTTVPGSWSKSIVNGRYGVLDLRLAPRSYAFQFVTTDGVVRDSGSRAW